jgi:cell wall-associated NlpC family hydrolase
MSSVRPLHRTGWVRRACGLGLASGLLLAPVAADAAGPGASTTTTKPATKATHGARSTTTTTTIPAASDPTPEQVQAASDLLDRVRRMTASLDDLDARYLRATAAATEAATKATKARQQFAATVGTYRTLHHQAERLVIRAYVGSDVHSGELAQFLSPAAATQEQVTRAYDAVVGEGLAAKLAQLEWLKHLRRAASDQAAAADAAAKASSRSAAKDLRAARAGEAQLLVALATADAPTKAALAKLEQTGSPAIAALLKAGSLSIPEGVDAPPSVLSSTPLALAYAAGQLGKPYRWGAAGPDDFDCSGLVQQAWAAAGVALPRVAKDQFAATTRLKFSDLQPGDLVFFEKGIGHVGIYVGDGVMIDAPHAGAVVQLHSIFWKDLAGFGRVTAS